MLEGKKNPIESKIDIAMDNSDTGECFIKKEIIYPGTKFIPYVDGTRVKLQLNLDPQF